MLLHLVGLLHRGDFLVQLLDDRGRRPGGRDDAPPVDRLVARHARLRDRGDVGQNRVAGQAAGAERAQLAGPDMRRGLHQRTEHHLGVAPDHVDHGRAAALERHMQEVDAGGQLEQLAAEMLEAADAGRGVLQLAGLLLCGREQVLHRMHRQVRVDHQDVRAGRKNGDRRE
jgi:hypothetical protein